MSQTIRTALGCAFLVGAQLEQPVLAESGLVASASSPSHRIALLELYTSEGCSSCPPADRWLSRLTNSGITGREIVPPAFHVTYWDYIGWKDRFASPRNDQRQRQQAAVMHSRTLYTPQFLLNGRDFRRYRSLDKEPRGINAQPAALDLTITVSATQDDRLHVHVDADQANDGHRNIALYGVLYENDLDSKVADGENQGRHLRHDHVVRRFYSAAPSRENKQNLDRWIPIENDWHGENMGVAAFAQDVDSGAVLQALTVKVTAKGAPIRPRPLREGWGEGRSGARRPFIIRGGATPP